MSAGTYPVEEHELRRAADSLHAFRYWSDASTVESALIELLALRAEKQRLLDWQTQATVNCAKRKCASRERDMADCEAERDRLVALLVSVDAHFGREHGSAEMWAEIDRLKAR